MVSDKRSLGAKSEVTPGGRKVHLHPLLVSMYLSVLNSMGTSGGGKGYN